MACTVVTPSPRAGVRQDIVTAHEHFNMEDFVQQFQEALKVTAPRKRAFLLSWMQVPPAPVSTYSLRHMALASLH